MWQKEKRGAEGALEETARALREAWRGARAEGTRLTLRRGREEAEFDLGRPGERFELLLLAILAGAKVQEATAVATFNVLREKGLTDLGRLAAHAGEDEAEVQAVLQEHYRALANKVQKAAALFAAAERVRALYRGDVLGLRVPGQPWQETLKALREFPHLKSRSYWYCREMARHGLWPDLEPQACAAVDTPVKLALWRLGYVGEEAAFLRDIPTGDCLRAIDRFFGGDTLPLFYQGDQVCRLGESRCAGLCRVTAYCRWSRRPAENTEQPFALSTGTCG
jgi:hypothetical protein